MDDFQLTVALIVVILMKELITFVDNKYVHVLILCYMTKTTIFLCYGSHNTM